MICDGFFYYPSPKLYGSPSDLGLRHEVVAFSTRDGLRLHGWFFPACTSGSNGNSSNCNSDSGKSDNGNGDNGNGDNGNGDSGNGDSGTSSDSREHGDKGNERSARGTVLHLHGNAGNMSGHFQHVAWLPAAGWNVLCFDYRGYGRSEGKVTREGTILDAHGALDYLLSRGDVDPQRIAAFGQSLGGAIGIVLAAERPEIGALAVDGAFDSYRGVAAYHIRHNPLLMCVGWWVPRFLMSDGYDPVDYVGRIAPRPLLIIHGTADTVVPIEMADALFAAAGEPRTLWRVNGANHYDPLRDHADEARKRLLNLFGDPHPVETSSPD